VSQTFLKNLNLLKQSGTFSTLTGIQRGIEKEGLRTTPAGELSQSAHPAALGSALAHPSITTDFSEALLEFVTPVMPTPEAAVNFLEDLHRFAYEILEEEIIWSSSMPCFLGGESSIPIAQYGKSNIGTMKHIYRVGLEHRYGKTMQTIAGIHYNFSLPDDFWTAFRSAVASTESDRDFRDQQYFGLIRNFRRNAWLLLLLFGASPAVCGSFIKGLDHKLLKLEGKGYYLPWATSLRMGGLGYTSDAQSSFRVCYNSVESYTSTLGQALNMSYPPYEKIGAKNNGRYLQLNDRLLQIENEYYSDIRPKRVTPSGTHPSPYLKQHGVEYIEVRNLDLNPFLPVGIDSTQARFVDSFLLYCLLQDSPQISTDEYAANNQNKTSIIIEGRKPGLKLKRNEETIDAFQWATALTDGIGQTANLLDESHGNNLHTKAVAAQKNKLLHPDLFPSAQMLHFADTEKLSFSELGIRLSSQHKANFKEPLPADKRAEMDKIAVESLEKQKQIEDSDTIDFDDFLTDYFARS
jgi:glutamate--cysteine ligase